MLNIITMKAQINKSAVMKRAWSIFRGPNRDYNYSFSASLRRTWAVEKESIAYQQRQADELAAWNGTAPVQPRPVKEVSNMIPAYSGLAEYYQAGMGGRIYYGD